MSESGIVEPGRFEPASLAACFRATDLEWRLRQIPDEAQCRGAFFRMLQERAAGFGPEVEREYLRLFPASAPLPFLMYPVRDYLTRIVVLAQVRYGAAHIHEGLRALQATAFDAWGSTMLGRAAMAVVERRPAPILRMLERAYETRTVNNHARLRVVQADANKAVVRIEHEYLYIESAMVGALEGVARFCGLEARSSVALDDAFDGTVTLEFA